jgi:hypothetical protein
MERADEKPRANLEPEQVPGQTEPVDTTAERRPEDLPAGSQQQERDQETGGEAARDRRDYEQAPEGQDYGRQQAAASPEAQTAGAYGTAAEGQAAQGQAAASYDEAAERKAVQPPGAATSTLDPSDTRDHSAPMSDTPETAGTAGTDEQPGVLPRQDAQGFQTRWEAVQAVFVDDPQAATEQADALVGEVMDQLLRLRQEYLTQLRGAVGDGADTEAMRIALRRYRAFFNVLLGT